jgi:multiple sugar transport system substrate-binding protein
MRITRRELAGAAASAALLGATGARAETALKSVWVGWPDEQIKPMIDAFMKATPGVGLAYERIPFNELFQVLEVRLGARTPEPDFFTCDSPLTASYAIRNQIMALDDVLDTKRFSRPAVAAGSYRGKLYSAPFATSSCLLFYNRALFRKAGVEPPAADVEKRWTWDQVVKAGRKMADPAANQWGLILEQAERPYQCLPFGQSLGGKALSDDGLQATGYLDGPAFVEGFTFLQRLYTDFRIAPPGVFDNTVTPDIFGSGRSAMFIGNTYDMGLFADKYKDLDWGIAPHPSFAKGRPVTPTGSWHLAINPRTRNRDAVANCLRFLTSDDMGVLFFKLRAYPPVVLSVWDRLPEVFSTPPWRIVRYELDNTAVPRPATPGFREFEDLLRLTLRDLQQPGNVKQMLTATAEKIDRELRKYRT